MSASNDARAAHPFYIVDAFTKRRRRGNPAAVVVARPGELSDSDMQSLAAEFNLSETAFVVLPEVGNDGEKSSTTRLQLPLRWFTPECEVALCGHATLAAAAATRLHLLGGGAGPDEGAGDVVCQLYNEFVFDTMSGLLPVNRNAATDQWSLDFPLATIEPIRIGERDATPNLIKSVLGEELGESSIVGLHYSPDRQKLLIELEPRLREQFLRLKPDPAAMLTASPSGAHVRGVIVTVSGRGYRDEDADGDKLEFDFLSRYFAPWVGIPEDPVTGAAHTVLAAYWRAKLGGRDRMLAKQCSRRGGVVQISVDAERGRVSLTGNSVLSAHGRVML